MGGSRSRVRKGKSLRYSAPYLSEGTYLRKGHIPKETHIDTHTSTHTHKDTHTHTHSHIAAPGVSFFLSTLCLSAACVVRAVR